MVRHEETLTCLRCGYALQGLPARKCGECGQVYLRCPECGGSQVANEAQNRVLLRMRARARRLPGLMQIGQIGFLVAAGVILVILGFVMGMQGRMDGAEDVVVPTLLAGLASALVRLLVLRLRTEAVSVAGAAGFVAGAFVVGMVFATAIVPAQAMLSFMMMLPAVVGAVAGAMVAPAVGWLILRLYVREGDWAMLTEAYDGALKTKLTTEGVVPEGRHLLYCNHCAAELPAMAPRACGECGLLWVECPKCGQRCGVSGTVVEMVRFGEAMRVVRAGMAVCVRLLLTVTVWVGLAGLMAAAIHGYNRTVGPMWGIFWVPTDTLVLTIILVLVAGLRWFVVVGRTWPATLWIAVLVFCAGWVSVPSYNNNGLWVHGVSEVGGVLFVTVMAVVAVLVASALAFVVQASLPKRRVAMLEEVVPELARERTGEGR